MDSNTFQVLGLSKAEEQVYKSLIILGTSTTGKIIKESKIPSSHVYNILKKLIEKGLVTYFISNNIKYFQATDPKNLNNLYEQKKEELFSYRDKIKEQIAQLISISKLTKDEQEIKIYEGLPGIKSSIEKMLETLKEGETYYVLGAPLIGNKKLNAYYKDIHKRRIKKKIKFKIIYNKSAEKYAKEKRNLNLTEIKVADIDTPTELCIFSDYVQIIIFSRKPILLEIRNEETSKSFLKYFEIIWKISKKLINN